MKYSIRLICFIAATLLLSACGSIYETHYFYQPPHTQQGKMCIMHCAQIKHNCQTLCRMQDQNCRRQARQDAYYHYAQYQQYQNERGLPVQKHLSDFEKSYSKCFHTCHCADDFNACFENCGGVVTEQKEYLD